MLIEHARISKADQNLELQLDVISTIFNKTSYAIYYQQFRLYYCEQTD